MLNSGRYLNLYWGIHQWNTNTAVTYKFHTFYRKLNFLTTTAKLMSCQLPYYDVPFRIPVTFSNVSFSKRVVIFKKYNNYFKSNYVNRNPQSTKTENIKFLICKPTSTYTLRKPAQGGRITKLNVIVNEINFFSKAWVVGYKKLSFYVKKTIVYEKNRKVRKAKLFLQFSKLYNFFKNIVNVFLNTSNLPKKYIYVYFLKKQFKLSVNYIFKCLAQKLVTQKKTPLILNVPYRK